MNNLNGNKGEWSELYALLLLLTEAKLYPANDNLEIENSNFYPITKITTNSDSENKITYIISSEDDITIQKPQAESVVIKREVVKKYIERFFEQISAKHISKGAFSIPEAKEIMSLLNRETIAAASFQKADLILDLYDSHLLRNTELGYSIKSQVGGLSTLFNSSAATNLLYEVENLNGSQIEEINNLDSCRQRVERIYELGGKLSFIDSDNQNFAYNLSLIDSNFIKILAEAVLMFNLTDKRSVSEIAKELPKSELNFGSFEHDEDFYKLNFKKFLFNSALGMVAHKRWNGLITSDGGIIVVKRNGRLAGYNPGSLSKVQEYIYENTKFDTPSSRNKFGKITIEDEKIYMKLNFQIRFKK